MKASFLILIMLVLSRALLAQNRLNVVAQNADERQPLVGANVYFDSLNIGASTNANGRAHIDHIPNGRHTLIVSYVGFQTEKLVLDFPRKDQQRLLTVLLEAALSAVSKS